MPEIERADPPYQQILAEISRRIESEELPHGARIPSARQICREWHVAMGTAARVLLELKVAGLTRTEAGRGTFVHHPRTE